MPDPGTMYTDKKQQEIEERLRRIYGEAREQIEKSITEHTDRFKALDAVKYQQMMDGNISPEQYQSWKRGQVFIGKRWQEKLDSITKTINSTNKIADGIVNGEKRAVFRENATYQAYQLEHDAKMNLSFTVYDSATVTRLIRSQPELLKRRIVNDKVDRAWNRELISDIVAKGIITGARIPDIAQEIADKTAYRNESATVRYARTVMTAAQNAGRYAALHDAGDMGIKVKKVWLATLDSRTRDSHADLDGETKDVDEEFSNGLMYPGEPGGPAAEVWNCRCTLVYKYDEYPIQNATRYDQENNEVIGNMTYKEWKEWKGGQTTVPQHISSITDQLKELLKQAAPDVYKVGGLFSKIIHDKYDSLVGDELSKAKKELEDLEFDYESNAIIEAQRTLSAIMRGFGDKSIHDVMELLEPTSIYEEARKMDKLDLSDYLRNRVVEIERKKSLLRSQIRNSNYTYQKSAGVLKETLAEYRTMGADGLDLKRHLSDSRSPMRKVVEEAYGYYPRSWVEASMNRGRLTPKKVDRGFYDDYDHVIAISGAGGPGSFETAVHELGHRFERAVPAIRAAEKEFYVKRTAGESLAWLGPGYARSEVTRKDQFISPYMGKDYGGSAYELVSMGFEYAYTQPEKLRKDPDMESWIYGLLLTQ